MSSIYMIENLNRSFRVGTETIHALKNINISVSTGNLCLLCGKSGSGKTTLLNIMGTLDRPDKGKIYFNNKDITNISENEKDAMRRKKIGFVFQSVALMPMMSAYENVEYSLRVCGSPIAERKKRVEECLDMVGLAKRMHHMPNELSGGEQQRVAIARSIVHKPEIIFADEPTAELDTAMGIHVIKLIKNIVKKENLTVVMTTHDSGLVKYADTLYTMQDGEIINE
jgi:putative ABC transport system ATP-binding protein